MTLPPSAPSLPLPVQPHLQPCVCQTAHLNADEASAAVAATGIVKFVHRFELGAIVVSPEAMQVLRRFGMDPSDLLHRHASGDSGDAQPDVRAANERAMRSGGWVVSAYVMRSPIGAHPHRAVVCITTDTAGRFTAVQVLDERPQAAS